MTRATRWSSKTTDNRWTERLARAATIEMGGSALLAAYPMSGEVAKKSTVRGTLGLCARIGETLREVRGAHGDPVAALCELLAADALFHGRVADVERRTVGGFARGRARLNGLDACRDQVLHLDFQNEFLIAERDGEVLVTTPDFITAVDAETGAPITADGLRYGQRLAILAWPCDPIWRSQAGLDLVGPRYFGYERDYVPLRDG